MIETQDSHRILPHLQIGSRPIPPQSISAVNLIHNTTSLRNQNFINSCFCLFHRSPLPTSTPTLCSMLKLELALIIRHVSNFRVFSIYVIYAINNVIWDTREQQNLERRVQQRISWLLNLCAASCDRETLEKSEFTENICNRRCYWRSGGGQEAHGPRSSHKLEGQGPGMFLSDFYGLIWFLSFLFG